MQTVGIKNILPGVTILTQIYLELFHFSYTIIVLTILFLWEKRGGEAMVMDRFSRKTFINFQTLTDLMDTHMNNKYARTLLALL